MTVGSKNLLFFVESPALGTARVALGEHWIFYKSLFTKCKYGRLVCMQDVSTMIRYRLNPVIFLINNGGYTIEVEIHDGPYNTIQGWDYSGLVQCFDNHQGNVFSCKVGCTATPQNL